MCVAWGGGGMDRVGGGKQRRTGGLSLLLLRQNLFQPQYLTWEQLQLTGDLPLQGTSSVSSSTKDA